MKKPTYNVVMLDFDFEDYAIEISYLKDEVRMTNMGSFDCHVLLAGPAGIRLRRVTKIIITSPKNSRIILFIIIILSCL